MHRKWKKVYALGMAALLGCLMPMGTMLAAEEDTEVVQEMEADSGSDADVVSDAEIISDDNDSIGDEVDAEEEIAGDEVNVDEENAGVEVNAEDENVIDEADTDNDENADIAIMSVADAEAGDVAVQEDTAAPVIDITLNGENCKVDGLGGNIDYKYTSSSNSKLGFSASQNGTSIMFRYYLDENPGDKAKDEDDISWSGDCSSLLWTLSDNKTYVLYVKAEANGQTVYARSCGIVVDTIAPKIVGVENGGTYPAGTTFTVEDANLDVVMVNETPVTPEADGSYQVKANGTSCAIRAIDKAKNETVYSITVSGEKPVENTVISESGTYSLKTGTSYRLAAGTWQVGGDSTVYQGGIAFYVKAAGDYSFTKQ